MATNLCSGQERPVGYSSRDVHVDLSIVVPVFNEADNLAELYRQIRSALVAFGSDFEVIFVDDGSTDESFERAGTLARLDNRVRALRLGRNRGQATAIQAGCDAAKGKIVVTIDGDLQNDPADIPRLLAEMEGGVDVVCGWRKRRREPFLTRRLPSLAANLLLRLLTGLKIHDHGCTLKAFRREVFLQQPLYSDMHRFALSWMDISGVRYSEVVVNDRPRASGSSKYGLERVGKVILDLAALVMIRRYWMHPGRWFLLGGLPFALLALISGAAAARNYVVDPAFDAFPLVWLGGALLSVFAMMHFILLAAISELVVNVGERRPQSNVTVFEALSPED